MRGKATHNIAQPFLPPLLVPAFLPFFPIGSSSCSCILLTFSWVLRYRCMLLYHTWSRHTSTWWKLLLCISKPGTGGTAAVTDQSPQSEPGTEERTKMTSLMTQVNATSTRPRASKQLLNIPVHIKHHNTTETRLELKLGCKRSIWLSLCNSVIRKSFIKNVFYLKQIFLVLSDAVNGSACYGPSITVQQFRLPAASAHAET